MSLKQLIAIFFVLVLLNSCTSYKNVPYFQDLKLDSISREKITNYSPMTIQVGDLLRLHVTSLNNETDAIFNYNLERPNQITNLPDVNASVGTRSEPTSVVGYLIDHDGNMHLPMVGLLKVTGLTVDEATPLIEAKLQTILINPTVNLTIENLQVSVLGDVSKPDTYNFQGDKITINEALAYAGDLNPTGIRKILLVREVNGTREYIPLDLKSKNIFTSPYYYLKNNDVIYVTPNRQKVISSDASIPTISLLISALSVLAILITRTK